MSSASHEPLTSACERAGIPHSPREPIRLGENQMWRLPDGVVARIARPGQEKSALKEVAVARWLQSCGIPATRAVAARDNPVMIQGRAISFWEEIPPHRKSRTEELAVLLRRLHQLDPPEFLDPVDPFVRTQERIDIGSQLLSRSDQDWLRHRLTDLHQQWDKRIPAMSRSVIHGDAHNGNVLVPHNSSPLFIDLERFAVGPSAWDLTLTAVEYVTCGWIPRDEYSTFSETYGQDVTTTPEFNLILAIRELRMTLFAIQLAAESSRYRAQACERLACVKGERGHRPWPQWAAIP